MLPEFPMVDPMPLDEAPLPAPAGRPALAGRPCAHADNAQANTNTIKRFICALLRLGSEWLLCGMPAWAFCLPAAHPEVWNPDPPDKLLCICRCTIVISGLKEKSSQEFSFPTALVSCYLLLLFVIPVPGFFPGLRLLLLAA